jgi:hypothetical protein
MPEVIVADALDMRSIRELWTEYWRSAGLDPQFQGFADELSTLPGAYAPPAAASCSQRSTAARPGRPRSARSIPDDAK